MSILHRTISFISRVIKSIWVLMHDIDIFYYSLYILANIMGLIYHPFFFAFHLMDILKLQQMQVMVQALWYPRIELLVTLLLILIILYYFSIVVFTFFYDELDNYMILNTYTEYTQVINETKKDWVYSCSTLWMCYITLIEQTFK